MISFVCLLIAAAAMVFVGRPLFTRREKGPTASRGKSRRAILVEQRDACYGAIRELDFDHKMGKVEAGDYERMRAEFARQAVTVLKELDRSNGRAQVDEEVEREVALIRKKKGQGRAQTTRTCATCGASVRSSDRFCPQCGSKTDPG